MEPVAVSTLRFDAPDGTSLEGDLIAPADCTGTAVVCHPHPLYGGSRADGVVAALCRGFVEAGRRVLRFDFRGTGGSSGLHGGGGPERTDLLAAIDAVEPGGSGLTIAGYSFGADIALSVEHPAAEGWLVVAPPLSVFGDEVGVASTDPRPVRILHPEHDQFHPPDQLHAAVEGWANCSVEVLTSTDHFMTGAHQRVTQRAHELVG